MKEIIRALEMLNEELERERRFTNNDDEQRALIRVEQAVMRVCDGLVDSLTKAERIP